MDCSPSFPPRLGFRRTSSSGLRCAILIGLSVVGLGISGTSARPLRAADPPPTTPATTEPAQSEPAQSGQPQSEPASAQPGGSPSKISYWSQIRPIFQAHCQGCHQPAKQSGQYVMTNVTQLQEAGESGEASVVPGNPDGSYLVKQITVTDGQAAMPQKAPPLAAEQIELIRQWIAQGAVDDTPASAEPRFDADHPPTYHALPVITALAASPDGQLLAVSGYHEVLLLDAAAAITGTVDRRGRLVGVSERIEAVRFSPDGKLLAVAGGSPGRVGEVQIWDVEKRELVQSHAVGYDTCYGICWSPDGNRVAFGCPDNSVRAIDITTGQQVFFNGAHNDWVLDTAFSVDGKHLVSASRDRSLKLYEFETQRFIDNITSITPGALKGGLHVVVRHPQRDELLIGGADGIPKLYRMLREKGRQIGDDHNLVRAFPQLPGRVYSAVFSKDGQQLLVGSSLRGAGFVRLFRTEDATQISQADELAGGVYEVMWSADERHFFAGGFDGQLVVGEAQTGQIVAQLTPPPLEPASDGVATTTDVSRDDAALAAETPPDAPPSANTSPSSESNGSSDSDESSQLHAYTSQKYDQLSILPAQIELNSAGEYVQVVILGHLPSGETVDLTPVARLQQPVAMVSVTEGGLVSGRADGAADLVWELPSGQTVVQPCSVQGASSPQPVSFVRDVAPVLSRLGCNAGTCHGSKDGQNGFKLSLRGYDFLYDHEAFTDEIAARRINRAAPAQSLMLLKATATVPHVGGRLVQADSDYYRLLHAWIAQGARLDLDAPRVTGIEIQPTNPVVPLPEMTQSMRVVATYGDGSQRDVSREAFVESGNIETVEAQAGRPLKMLRRGEAPVLARFEGSYTATTITVMGDRSSFAWSNPETHNRIDELVYAKLQRVKVLPSELCTDDEFIRRVYLDLTGLQPPADKVRQFLADSRPTQEKRNELIDQLIGSSDYVQHWTNKWADLLQVNRKHLGEIGAGALRDWIEQAIALNKPYNQMAYELLTARGSTLDNPAAAYWKILREPAAAMENTTHLFLAVRFNCNKCHDHPFERWTQDQYYHMAAYFAQVGRKEDPSFAGQRVGGTAVDQPVPLVEVIYDQGQGEINHDRTGAVAAPQVPYQPDLLDAEQLSRRDQLAHWITSDQNQYFATSYVNRLWGYLLGVGVIEPIDDIRAGNPPSNPELLNYLTTEFIESGFDTQHILRLICQSRVYQHSLQTNRWNEDDTVNYSHALPRRLPAEVLFDAIHAATGSAAQVPGLPPGIRAAELPDAGVSVAFLDDFGRPARESACECERSNGVVLGPIMKLINGPTVADALADPQNALVRLEREIADDDQLIEEIFLRFLARKPTERERELARSTLSEATRDLDQLEKQLQELTSQLDAGQQAWEDAAATVPTWHVARPEKWLAPEGTQFAVQEDGAILVSGERRNGDYELLCRIPQPSVTGLQLTALPHPSLPAQGPGRADNGNFVLGELQLEVIPAAETADAAASMSGDTVKLSVARADTNQQGYPVEHAVDGQPGTGWAVMPAVGRPSTAIFATADATPISSDSAWLRIRLQHAHPDGQHLLGHFRLSWTDSPQPTMESSLPAELRAALAQPRAERSEAAQQQITDYYRRRDPAYVELFEQTARVRALAQNQRLVGVQDLAWALINNPAFLFNR